MHGFDTGFITQAYRELLCTTPGLGQYISGAIMFEETLYQNTTTGTTMVDELNKQNIMPGMHTAMHLLIVTHIVSSNYALGRRDCIARRKLIRSEAAGVP